MKRRLVLATALASAVLAACGKSKSPEDQAAAAPAQPVSIDAIAAEAKGFDVGSLMSAHVVYVFFDPQCPHCAELWEAAKPLKAQARFVWIPVALLNDKSGPEGAAILHAADPAAAMEQHEESMRARQGGIDVAGATDALKDAVKHNTELMTRYGFTGVPTLVSRGKDGQLLLVEGAMPTPVLAQKLGLLPSP